MIKLQRPSIPANIDSDLSIAVVGSNLKSFLSDSNIPIKESYVFKGKHERTAKGDNILFTLSSSAKRHSFKYFLRRNSLYHILPEFLFHPLDRYANTDRDKEEFIRLRKEQKDVETNALDYFYPFDRYLQQIRTSFQYKLNDEILNNNLFVVDFITEGHNINKKNEFIMSLYPCIIWLRNYRGVHKLLEVAIKYAFGDNIHAYNLNSEEISSPIDSNTCHMTLDGEIDDLFCGPYYFYLEETINVEFQTKIVSNSQIENYISSISEFEGFFKSWFLSLNQSIKINFGDYLKYPILNVGTSDNDLFLGYNTQLI